MGFRFESEMAKPVRQWLRRRGFLVKEEFLLPWGVCDFVAVSLNAEKVQQRLDLGQQLAIGSLFRINMLNHIPDHDSGNSISLRRLQKECGDGVPHSFVEAELNKLRAGRFVVQSRKGFFQKLNGWVPLHERVVAIELKLNRVSEALAQAYSNRAFATESYVAFPSDLANRLSGNPRRSVFNDAGIGIIAVGKTKCEIVLPAIATEVSNENVVQMHCVERFWRTRDS